MDFRQQILGGERTIADKHTYIRPRRAHADYPTTGRAWKLPFMKMVSLSLSPTHSLSLIVCMCGCVCAPATSILVCCNSERGQSLTWQAIGRKPTQVRSSHFCGSRESRRLKTTGTCKRKTRLTCFYPSRIGPTASCITNRVVVASNLFAQVKYTYLSIASVLANYMEKLSSSRVVHICIPRLNKCI